MYTHEHSKAWFMMLAGQRPEEFASSRGSGRINGNLKKSSQTQNNHFCSLVTAISILILNQSKPTQGLGPKASTLQTTLVNRDLARWLRSH